MVHVLVTGTYPPTKFKPLLALVTGGKQPPYPDYIKKIHNWAAPIEDGRYKLIAVYEAPNDKLYETLKAIAKRYDSYAQVEGYAYKAEVLIDANEAMQLMVG